MGKKQDLQKAEKELEVLVKHTNTKIVELGKYDYSLYVALKKLTVNTAVTGAVQLKINQANLCALEMPRIGENKLLTFNQEIDPLFLKIIQIRAEIEKLNELKQLYLHKFFG
jgi:type I restriction enzyme S subunit